MGGSMGSQHTHQATPSVSCHRHTPIGLWRHGSSDHGQIPRRTAPRMERVGIAEDDIHTILVINPQQPSVRPRLNRAA